jgi:hypothetical protein
MPTLERHMVRKCLFLYLIAAFGGRVIMMLPGGNFPIACLGFKPFSWIFAFYL